MKNGEIRRCQPKNPCVLQKKKKKNQRIEKITSVRECLEVKTKNISGEASRINVL